MGQLCKPIQYVSRVKMLCIRYSSSFLVFDSTFIQSSRYLEYFACSFSVPFRMCSNTVSFLRVSPRGLPLAVFSVRSAICDPVISMESIVNTPFRPALIVNVLFIVCKQRSSFVYAFCVLLNRISYWLIKCANC